MGWRVLLARRALERTQWYPPERLRRLQAARLRPLLHHAYRESPYYHHLLSAAGLAPGRIRTLGDLERIPLTTREEMMRRAAEITARDAQRYLPIPASTGGTTGAPLQVLVDQDTGRMVAGARARFQSWAGIRPGDRIAEFRHQGAFRLPSGEQDYQTVSRLLPQRNLLRFNRAAIREVHFGPIVEALERFRPDAIICTPALLTFLSLYVFQHPGSHIALRAIFCGGERLFPDQRQAITQAFAAPVFETYGNREHAAVAGECPEGRLHFAAEIAIVEVLHNGRPCLPGEMGEVVLTNLWNRSFPIIRYAIGDAGYLDPDPCPCGRGLPTGRILGGKERDLLATPSGYVHLSNSFFAQPKWRGKLVGIRYYQETREAVTVQIVKGPDFVHDDERVLVAELDQWFGGQLKISVEYYDNLEQTAGGKYRSIVSRVPLTL